VLAVFDLGGACHLLGGIGDHLLGQFHHLQIIRVCPIEFQLREFRVVLERHTFIAEVAPDLINAFHVTDKQTLEIQLERNAQVHILIQFIVMRHERTRCRAAIQRLEDGRFHFKEIVVVEKSAQGFDKLCTLAERLAHIGVDCEVGIALARANSGSSNVA
jgi:hypothetical protein